MLPPVRVRREVGQRLLSEVPQLLDVARAMTPEMALRRAEPGGRVCAGPACRHAAA